MKNCKECFWMCGLIGFIGAAMFILGLFGLCTFLDWKKHHLVASIKKYDLIKRNSKHSLANLAIAMESKDIFNDDLDKDGRCKELIDAVYLTVGQNYKPTTETDISDSYLYFNPSRDEIIGSVK